jgi:putative addiction module component (TIGR02574 family)
MSRQFLNIEDMSTEEQLRLLEELWKSLSQRSEAIPFTPEQREELDRRLDDLEREGACRHPLGRSSAKDPKPAAVKSLIFRPTAAADVEEAYDWYESRRTDLGEEFSKPCGRPFAAWKPSRSITQSSDVGYVEPPPTLSIRTLLSCL